MHQNCVIKLNLKRLHNKQEANTNRYLAQY